MKTVMWESHRACQLNRQSTHRFCWVRSNDHLLHVVQISKSRITSHKIEEAPVKTRHGYHSSTIV